ncbi:hypothetical protein [Paenibacillus sp. FSL R7-0652]|uniref:stalk domain-containing protein n=1 Tax=Paenibacillus sp. FSL R7-0652 TaxID=2921687 RepID=UPI003159B2C6
MYSNVPANHVTTEKSSSSSYPQPMNTPKSKSFRRLTKAVVSAGAVSCLLLSLLSSVTSTDASAAAVEGQPFTGNASDRPVSAPAVSPVSSNTEQKLHYTAVEGGYYYTVALRSDGSVWSWGRNLLGELGISETIRYRHTFSPVRIPHLSDVTAISTSGGGYSAAVQADGSVWHWGAGRTPRAVPGITNAAGVTAGSSTSLVLLRDGTVQSWHNPTDKLPGTSSHEAEREPVLHPIRGLNHVVQTALAGMDGYALKKDGSVWTWKEADKTNAGPSKPKQIKGLTRISYITDQSGDLLVLDAKGKVWRVDSKGKRTPYHHELTVKKMDASSNYVLLVTAKGEVYSYGNTVTGKQGKIKQLSDITDVSAGYYHSLARSSNGTVWGWGGDKYQEAGAPATSSGGMVYTPVQAKLGTDLIVNGKLLPSMYPAVETSAALQLPIKVIATALGAQFQVHTTEGQQSHYTLTYNDRIITVRPNESQYTVSSRNQNKLKEAQVITLSEPIGNYSGAVTAPYEMFRGLGLNVTWDRSRAALNMDDTKQAASAH